jgi:hypothetical protein
MSLLAAAALRTARVPMRRAVTTGRRNFSAEQFHADHVKTMENWKKYTYMGLPVIGGLLVFNVYLHFAHGHHHSDVTYSYQKIRSKAFPWSCPDCALFDQDCWNACKGK